MKLNKPLDCLLLLTILAAGCGPAPTPTIAHSTQQVTPVEIPQEMPLFPGAVEQSPIGSARLYAAGSAEIGSVIEFYKDQMNSLGWELLGDLDTSTSTTGETRTLMFAKDRVILSIAVFTKDGDTLIAVTATSS